jgi:hypothetical protein
MESLAHPTLNTHRWVVRLEAHALGLNQRVAELPCMTTADRRARLL